MSTDLILDPPRGVGLLQIGMPYVEALKILQAFPGLGPQEDGAGPGVANYASGLTILVESNQRGKVLWIEIYRPDVDVRVLYEGIDVFALPAKEVVAHIAKSRDIEVLDGGRRVVVPDLLLSFWRRFVSDRSVGEEGYFFESVLVASPGLYGSASREVPGTRSDLSGDGSAVSSQASADSEIRLF